ncbi:type II secretion system protein [Thalassotalea insulae]|uniref:Type II secretion system protein n=1 Tax=Thalassotalea insulae TaxID=2056778 RepID=A0ABQ6GT09_9GAMM|nr:type II secretion system F family protein [Thalassotalea insulae]GLX77590.1 type II secretion system protein [Thalassotalea insulae]
MSQKFKYKALTKSGEKVTDFLFASNIDKARIELKQKALIVLSITPETGTSFTGGEFKVSSADLEQSTNQLATLLENGLRINEALDILVDTAPSQGAAIVWKEIYTKVQTGSTLHSSLENYPEYFDVLYLEMVNIAENTGTLPQVFRSLSDNLSFQRDLKNKSIQALIYPLIILLVCVCAIFSIFNFVVPNMESVFTSAKNLPSYTQWLLNTSHFVSENNLFILFFVIGGGVFITMLWRQPKTKQSILSTIASFPLLGKMIQKSEQIRFCSAMSLTLASGLNLSDSLVLSIKTLTSEKNKEHLEQSRLKVDSGKTLADSLADSHFLDRVALSLIKVGEQSGSLERSFNEITQRAKTDFESWILRMTTLLEPLLIMMMGAIVGGVVIIMLLSIVSVNDLSL